MARSFLLSIILRPCQTFLILLTQSVQPQGFTPVEGDTEYHWRFINQYIKIPDDMGNKVDQLYGLETTAVRHCIKLIVTNLRARGIVAYSKRDDFYAGHHTKYYTKANFLRALELVTRDKYAFRSKRGSKNIKFQKGISSRISPLERLYEDFPTQPSVELDLKSLPLLVVDKHLIYHVNDLALIKPNNIRNHSTLHSSTLLSPYGGHYVESQKLNRRYFNKMHLNFGRLAMNEDYLTSVGLTRIFKNGGCGRWFQKGGYSYQQLSEAERSSILLDGCDVAELDYSAMHPHILYAWEDTQCPDDFYERIMPLCGASRFVAKGMVLLAINAGKYSQVTSAINLNKSEELQANRSRMEEGREEKPILYDELKSLSIEPKAVIDAFTKAHPKIAKYVYSSSANRLMLAESNIMTVVLLRLMKQKVAALPVHDSVIVPKRHEDLARNTMKDCYRAHTGFEIPVK
jgi:hypothetical protein